MGYRSFRRHGLHFEPKWVAQRLQRLLLKINVAKIILHETDKPDAVLNLFETHGLSTQAGRDIDLLAIKANATTVRNVHGHVVERIARFWDAIVLPRGRSVNLSWILHLQSFMRTLVVKLFDKSVEPSLLLQKVSARRSGRFLLEGEVHPFMTPVLLRMPWLYSFYCYAKPEPPYRKLR